MRDVGAVSENEDTIDYFTYNNEKTSGTLNEKIVSTEDAIDNKEQIAGVFRKFNDNRMEGLYCMSRCTAKRDLEVTVSVQRDGEGSTSGSITFEAPSEDGTDSFTSRIKADDSGNVSGEVRYNCKIGSNDKDR